MPLMPRKPRLTLLYAESCPVCMELKPELREFMSRVPQVDYRELDITKEQTPDAIPGAVPALHLELPSGKTFYTNAIKVAKAHKQPLDITYIAKWLRAVMTGR